MKKNYQQKEDLNTKTNEELFYIFRGTNSKKTLQERYTAARILETRDFDFINLSTHITQWERERFNKSSRFQKIVFLFKFKRTDYLNILMFVAVLFLLTVVIIPAYFPASHLSFSFTGDIWVFLNALSLLACLYIFAFVGFFIKISQSFKKRKKLMDIIQS
jgi:hypothetical protein